MISELVTVRLWLIAATDLAMKFSKTPPERPPVEVWIPRSMIVNIVRHHSRFGAPRLCDVTLEKSVAETKQLV